MCYQEDRLVPDLSRAKVFGWLESRFHQRSESDLQRVQRRSHWYFQQLMKLAVAAHIPDLSDHFLIFDSDMIALRPLTWFLPLNVTARVSGGLAPFRTSQEVQVDRSKLKERERGCINPHPFRTLIHIGGWGPRYGYQQTHRLITGSPIVHGHDGKSLVTHNILVYRPYMAEFLRSITAAQYQHLPLGWALSILDAVSKLQDTAEVMVGFSEFWSYLSWVQDNYPCTVLQADQREWTRSPAVLPSPLPIAVLYKGSYFPICCPTTTNLAMTARQGYLFTGYELGSHQRCQYYHEAFREGYAHWFLAA